MILWKLSLCRIRFHRWRVSNYTLVPKLEIIYDIKCAECDAILHEEYDFVAKTGMWRKRIVNTIPQRHYGSQ